MLTKNTQYENAQQHRCHQKAKQRILKNSSKICSLIFFRNKDKHCDEYTGAKNAEIVQLAVHRVSKTAVRKKSQHAASYRRQNLHRIRKRCGQFVREQRRRQCKQARHHARAPQLVIKVISG